MKPDVKKIIADIKATKGNRKFCNGLAGTLQDDNYASSICKYVKTVTPERIDLLIEYAEKLEAEVTDMAVQLANAESKCRELAAENAGLKQRTQQLIDIISNTDNDYCMCGSAMKDHVHGGCGYPTGMFDYYYNQWLESDNKTPATDAFLAEVRAQCLNAFIQHHSAELDAHIKNGGEQFDEKSVRIRDIIVSARLFREQIRKGAAL
ncbi:hNH endonuclease [Escherichia coli]